jgi:succinate-semialdehyde dehydrogenase/glutarate-semialdehyde dehydrogenase
MPEIATRGVSPGATHVLSRDPATGEVWRRHAAASGSDVDAAVARARSAGARWAATGVRARAAVLERFRQLLVRRRAEVASVIRRENGRPALEALGTEVLVTLDYARFYAGVAPRELAGGWRTPASVAFWRKRVRIEHEPYGVVGVIAPWNYPFMLPAGVLLPALVAGNAVVLKPSELTTATGLLLGELLHEAGVPTDVLQVVPGAGETGAALARAAIDKMSFTGSVATGRKVAVACAERLVPCSLELGGSDPAIVLEDADPELAARGIAWARFSNAGQTCVAPKRVFVAAGVHDRFLAALVRQVERLRVGGADTGVDVGPLVHPSQVAALRAQLDDALAGGARIVAQAAGVPEGDGYFPPTVLVDVQQTMRVMREETFGPLLPVMRVRDADEAVARANDSPFGLSASVWSRDRARASAVASRLEAGTVAINDAIIVAGMAEVPHGGVKASGIGRAHGVAGLREFTRTRAVVDEVLPGVAQPWWFGYDARLGEELDAAIVALHGRGTERVGAMRKAAGLLRRLRGG